MRPLISGRLGPRGGTLLLNGVELRAFTRAAVLALLQLFSGCGPRPEEFVACKRICGSMAWEVPRAGVCHCYSVEHFRDEADGGGDR